MATKTLNKPNSWKKQVNPNTRAMRQLMKDVRANTVRLTRNSKDLDEWMEKLAPYTASNCFVTGAHADQVRDIVQQIAGVVDQTSLPSGSNAEIVKGTMAEACMTLVTNVGEDIKTELQRIAVESYNNRLAPAETSKVIGEKIDSLSKTRCQAIVRTETCRAANIANYLNAKKMGAKSYRVICNDGACEYCIEEYGENMDTVYDIEDTENLPPFHPNCRCTPVWSMDPPPDSDDGEQPETTNDIELTMDELQQRLSEAEFNELKQLNSMMRFSEGLINNPNSNADQIEFHTNAINNYTVRINKLKEKAKANTTPKLVKENKVTTYALNNNENSFSDVKITEQQFEKVITHQSKRENATIEYGNVIDNKTGKLIHNKDIKGSENRVHVPSYDRPYSVIHNHTNNGGFSGGDAYSHLNGNYQEVCYATTPKGVWIMRDTSQGTYVKKEGGVSENVAYDLKYKLDGKYREFANEGKAKYQKSYDSATTRREKDRIHNQLNEEVSTNYNNWLLEEFAVGKNRANLIEIEFVPKERLNDVRL